MCTSAVQGLALLVHFSFQKKHSDLSKRNPVPTSEDTQVEQERLLDSSAIGDAIETVAVGFAEAVNRQDSPAWQ